MINNVVIYCKDNCIFCDKAKELFESLGVEYRERNISDDNIRHELLSRLPQVKTVPQIYIDGRHIGGYTDLVNYIEEQH